MTDAFLTLLSSNLKLTYVKEPDGTFFYISLALLIASSFWLTLSHYSNVRMPIKVSNVLGICVFLFTIATFYTGQVYDKERNATVDVKALACDKTLTELEFDARKFDADFEKAIIWKCGVGSYQKFIIDARADYLKKEKHLTD